MGALCPTATTLFKMPEARRSAVALCMIARKLAGTREAEAAREASSFSFSDIEVPFNISSGLMVSEALGECQWDMPTFYG